MKNSHPNKKQSRVINRYSGWKYAVLIVTVVILTLSAIPTWYGEQPSIQVTTSHKSEVVDNPLELNRFFEQNNIHVKEIGKSRVERLSYSIMRQTKRMREKC